MKCAQGEKSKLKCCAVGDRTRAREPRLAIPRPITSSRLPSREFGRLILLLRPHLTDPESS